MSNPKPPPRLILHDCPVCSRPQVKIARKLDGGKLGSTNYVCPRAGECALGFNLTKVDTWVVV